MSRRSIAAGLAAATVLSFGTGAMAASGDCRIIRAATPTTPAVNACQLDVFLHVTGKVGNLSGVAGSGQSVPTWNATKPTASVQSGAGGGYAFGRIVDIASAGQPAGRPRMTGTYTGVLDSVSADLFITFPVYQNTGGGFPLLTRLIVDGEVIYDNFATAAGTEPSVPIEEAGTNTSGAIGRIKYAVDGIYAELESLDVANAADTQHTITLEVLPLYWGDGQGALLYDTSEVPSGLIFNRDKLTGFLKLKAADF